MGKHCCQHDSRMEKIEMMERRAMLADLGIGMAMLISGIALVLGVIGGAGYALYLVYSSVMNG